MKIDIKFGITEFENKEEAQNKANEINNSGGPNKICPLQGEVCTTRCVCWVPANVVKRNESKFIIYGFECGNQMFFRECGHEI